MQILEKIQIATYQSLTSSLSGYLARCSLKANTIKRYAFLRLARLLITVVGADADRNRRIHTVVGANAGGANGRIYTIVGADAGGANGRIHTITTERFFREFSQVAGEFTVGGTEYGLALVGQDVFLIHENNPLFVVWFIDPLGWVSPLLPGEEA